MPQDRFTVQALHEFMDQQLQAYHARFRQELQHGPPPTGRRFQGGGPRIGRTAPLTGHPPTGHNALYRQARSRLFRPGTRVMNEYGVVGDALLHGTEQALQVRQTFLQAEWATFRELGYGDRDSIFLFLFGPNNAMWARVDHSGGGRRLTMQGALYAGMRAVGRGS